MVTSEAGAWVGGARFALRAWVRCPGAGDKAVGFDTGQCGARRRVLISPWPTIEADAAAGAAQARGAIVSLTGLEVFDETVHKTNAWLKEIMQAVGPDRHRAYQALRAVLHCLRDRLTVEEVAQLGAQLPMLVRGIYYEAWDPTGKPEKIRSREEFLAQISAHLAHVRPINSEVAVRAVFQVLETHVTPGEIEDVIQALPHDIGTLWPRPTLADRASE